MNKLAHPKRIEWIDGLRGIGCICIFLHHFLLTYYPATYFGTSAESHISSGLDIVLSDLPFFFIINGNFWVCIYLFISGFIMVQKEPPQKNKSIFFIKYFLKRYLTLVFPIFLAEIAIFFGSIILPNNIMPDGGYSFSFLHYLKSTFFDVFFTCDRTVIGPLWTIQSIFLGGLLILGINLLIKRPLIRIFILSISCVFFLHFEYFWYFAPVILGGIFSILFPIIFNKQKNTLLSTFLLIIGCFFAAFPSGVISDGLYGYLPPNQYGPFLWHLLGAILFMYGINTLPNLKSFLAAKPFLWLGKISYPIYVFHIVVMKYVSILYNSISVLFNSYSLRILTLLVICSFFIIILSMLYSKFIEPLWKKVINTLLKPSTLQATNEGYRH